MINMLFLLEVIRNNGTNIFSSLSDSAHIFVCAKTLMMKKAKDERKKRREDKK
jgi:hypothetical protein